MSPRALPGPAEALHLLDTWCREPDADAAALRARAPACFWDPYMHLHLQRAARSGPEADARACAHILAASDRAAYAGAAGLGLPAALRADLTRWAAALHDAQAWRADTPLWWAPLPQPGPAERLWAEVTAGIRFPDTGPPPHPALIETAALAPDLLAHVAASLRAGLPPGLGLQREGVGADGALHQRRGDAVCYLDGTEPELLAAMPHLAAVVQWLLGELPARAARRYGRPLHAPARAMLACYTAPTDGYARHLDNPGGKDDNARAVSVTLYLQDPAHPCVGGGLAVWAPERPEAAPAHHVPPHGGTLVAFDSRTVPHQVQPLAPGPPRWTLVVWLSETPQRPPAPPIPTPTLSQLAGPLRRAPMAADRVAFHRLDDTPGGTLTVHVPRRRPRIGAVATVYRGGAQLHAWCAHHLAAGMDHLVLVFDHLEEPAEADTAARLRKAFPERLTVWSGSEAGAEAAVHLPDDPRLAPVRRAARADGSSQAVAARQTLNASLALVAARGPTLGGAPLDWLVHLDADERLVAAGRARGGATLHDAFAAAEDAGLQVLRFVNHELLPGPEPHRFKLNPHLAAARLGLRGWGRIVQLLGLDQEGARPWFSGYHNGKAAVAVAHGVCAAGVHGWYLPAPAGPANSAWVAGPHLLHLHAADADAFCAKYLARAAGEPAPPERLFRPSPVEEHALALIAAGRDRGESDTQITAALQAMFARLNAYKAEELALLEEAGVLWTADAHLRSADL